MLAWNKNVTTKLLQAEESHNKEQSQIRNAFEPIEETRMTSR